MKYTTLDHNCYYFIIKTSSLPTKSTNQKKKIYEFTQRYQSTHAFVEQEEPCPGLLP